MCHSKTRKQNEAWNSLHSCRLMTVQPDSFWHCMCRVKMQNQNFKNFYSLLYSMLLLLNKKVVTSLSILVEYADGNKRRRGKIARGAKNLTEITHKIFTPRAWGWQPLGRNWMGIITRTRFYGQYCVDSIRSLMNRDLAGFVWKTHHTSRHFQWISFSLLGISSLTARFAQFDWIFQPLDISESFIIMVNLSLPLRPLLSGCEQLVAPHPSLTLCVCVCAKRIFNKICELEFNVDDESCMVVAMNCGASLGFLFDEIRLGPANDNNRRCFAIALTRKLTEISKLKGRFWWTLSRSFRVWK